MGILLAVIVGYTLGAKAGQRGFDEVVDSLREIWKSEQFIVMVQAARAHAGYVLQEASNLVENKQGPVLDNLVERVQRLTGKASY